MPGNLQEAFAFSLKTFNNLVLATIFKSTALLVLHSIPMGCSNLTAGYIITLLRASVWSADFTEIKHRDLGLFAT